MESPGGSSIPRCCCGHDDCTFLTHNGALLEGLERDVQTAAQLGQALLQRHEAYIADSEAERRRMAAKIEQLEFEKADLETRNAKTVLENRELLDQLEAMNNAVADSDTNIHELTEALMSTQNELSRISVLASRTESLERQLASLEREQVELQNKLANTTGEERSAVARWRKAERTIASLQEQTERIEREAREERERHVEVIGRMERRRAVERELETAAGRLKGAAAAKTVDKNGSNVVSHFVKDILQDNANLQLGIVELREMLMNSNDEVERLRERLLLHQPMDQTSDSTEPPNLSKELDFAMEATPEAVQMRSPKELHVHHHYHAPPEAPKETPRTRGQLQRRASKKKRNVITPGHFAPPPNMLTPRNSISNPRPATPSSAATILSQTSVTIPTHRPRWSIASHQTGASIAASSVPSSPYSHSRRTSSIFDRIFSDAGQESSRPTSPESNNDPVSPMFVPVRTQGPVRTQTTPSASRVQGKATPSIEINSQSYGGHQRGSLRIPEEDLDLSPKGHYTIPEEQEHSESPSPNPESDISEDIYTSMNGTSSRRRASSHGSLLSVSGMDIHTVNPRPSQLFFSPSSPSPLATASLSNMTAHPSMSWRHGIDARAAHRNLLSGMAGEQRGGTIRSRPKVNSNDNNNNSGGLGRKVGGWFTGNWGTTPTPTATTHANSSGSAGTDPSSTLATHALAPTTTDGRIGTSCTTSTSTSTSTATATEVPADATSSANGTPQTSKSFRMLMRAPGVNQSGPIFGMAPAPPAPFKVVVQQEDVDVDALRESLAEAGDSPVRAPAEVGTSSA